MNYTSVSVPQESIHLLGLYFIHPNLHAVRAVPLGFIHILVTFPLRGLFFSLLLSVMKKPKNRKKRIICCAKRYRELADKLEE